MNNLIMALDQGTTSSRTILFDQNYHIVEQAQQEFTQHFPADGWVEHDPMDIWNTTLATAIIRLFIIVLFYLFSLASNTTWVAV